MTLPTIANGGYELVATDRLKHHPKNPRRGNVTAIRESIRENGFFGALVVQRGTSFVLVGNHRLRAACEEGLAEVPVLWVDVDDARASKMALADNHASDLATYDHHDLIESLSSLDSLVGTTFDPRDLAKLIRSVREPERAPEQTPPPVGDPIVSTGEVWRLGEHVLACGDSLDETARARVFEGRFDLVVTDPPFAIYGSSTGIGTDVVDDKMVRPFFERVFAALNAAAKTHAHAYVFCDWRSWPALWDACSRARGANRGGLTPANLLVWDKGTGMGSMYQNSHEFVGFFTVEAPGRVMKGKKSGARKIQGKHNVLRFNRVSGRERVHNAAKPVSMIEEFLENSSDKGDAVLDLFGGQGQTLLACEHRGRRCTMFEIDPAWCDVIVRRWQAETGKTAERVQA